MTVKSKIAFVPKGRNGFTKELEFNYSKHKMIVITGLNGSGKTTLLDSLYRDKIKENSGSVFFKTTNLDHYKKRSKYFRYRDEEEYDSKSVQGIWDELEREYIHFCRLKGIEKSISHSDMMNMIFNEGSEFYKFRIEFLYLASEAVVKNTKKNLYDIYKLFGLPNANEVKDEVRAAIKEKLGNSSKKGRDPKTDLYYKEYEKDFGFDRQTSVPKYLGSFKDEMIDLKILDENVRKDLYSSLKGKANNKNEFDDNLYSLINHFQSMEAIIEKIADKIDEDFQKSKGKRNTKNKTVPKTYWEEINQELSQYGEKFRYRLNKPSDHVKYEITFHSPGKTEYIGFKNLSSGEKVIFELICYYFVVKKMDGEEFDIMIFDEFDAHLNPAMAKIFLETVRKQFIENGVTVFLTTHSPSTVAYCKDEELFWMENESIDPSKTREEIIELLTPGILTFRKGILELLTNMNNVIITEGESDIFYIKSAAKKFGFNKIIEDVFFLPANGDKGKDFIKAFKSAKSDKKVMVIFDYDKTGIEAFDSCCDKDEDKIIKNKTLKRSSLSHAHISKNGSFFVLTIPTNKEDYPTECQYGYHPIEFLFKKSEFEAFNSGAIVSDESYESIASHYALLIPTKSIETIRLNFSTQRKGEFSKHVFENINKFDLENFKPLLEKISELFELK